MNQPTSIPTRELEQFVTIVRRLRRECPWDRKQTHASLRAGLLEETYEVLDAIGRRRPAWLRQELGDVLLHVVLQSVIAEQAGEFTLRDVLDEASDKLIRRHPHVFGSASVRTADGVKQQWEKIKLTEGRRSLLDGIPRALPALARAQRTQARAATVGFDWKKREDVWRKVVEEKKELHETLQRGSRVRQEEEFGDLLFSLVNLARFMGLDAEHALARATDKFTGRFREVERVLRLRGKDIHASTLEEMDGIWNTVKRRRKRRRTAKRRGRA